MTLFEFVPDFGEHEMMRVYHVSLADPDLDPAAILERERQGLTDLYSNLDERHEAILQMLIDEGVLEDVRPGR